MALDALHIGLPDIALLARVQRSPVSMWRSRFAASSTPFPTPVRTECSQPYFDGYAVVDWLETTGLGNNPGARSDLAAFAALGVTDEADSVVFAGMTALLCLGKFAIRLPVDADNSPISRLFLRYWFESEEFRSHAQGLMRENALLANLRDTLLRHLISGRLRVKDAEKQMEAVV